MPDGTNIGEKSFQKKSNCIRAVKFALVKAMNIPITSISTFGFVLLQTFVWAPASLQVSEQAGAVFSPRDSLLFKEKQEVAGRESSLSDKTFSVAHSFLGTPYVTGTLDGNDQEQVVVNLRQLDCWTLVECSLAIAQTGEGSPADYESNLQKLRYWGGSVKGYGSRIHYFTGWLLQAEKYGFLRDITRETGGVPYQKKVGYISARPAKYPQIRDPETFRALKAAEKRINAHKWHFIPQNRIKSVENRIEQGDIILLTSAKRDLDISHQGFAVRQNGRIHLLHASSLSKKVIISKQSLSEYVISQKGQTGIMIARLND